MNDPMGEVAARPIVRARCFLSQKRLVTNDRSAVYNNRSSTQGRAVMPNLPIVGIGASAGGVEALERFFKSMPADNGMGFVVVTHLPPNRESMLAEIIGRATKMPVVDARDGEMVEAEHVYVLPSGAVLTIREGRLRLRHTATTDHERTPINLFFSS